MSQGINYSLLIQSFNQSVSQTVSQSYIEQYLDMCVPVQVSMLWLSRKIEGQFVPLRVMDGW